MNADARGGDPPVIAFAGGGTGGHLYPALAVAQVLRSRLSELTCWFFGSQRAIDAQILANARYELIPQTLPPLQLAPWRWPAIWNGVRRARQVCRHRFKSARPLVVVGTGGMASIPAVLEARRWGVPIVLFNPDARPGKANRILARFADAVIVQWPDSIAHFPRASVVHALGCPVREAFLGADRAAGIARFGLDPQRATLLVTGASQGARTLNDVTLALGDFWRAHPEWQILHLAGTQDAERIRQACASLSIRAVVLAYTEHMAEALAAADLVLCRAGASTLAEITALGRASVLMPYPFHRDRHQHANAECLVRLGGGQMVEDLIDPGVNAARLRPVLDALMSDGAARRRMAAAALRIGRPHAAQAIADHIMAMCAVRD